MSPTVQGLKRKLDEVLDEYLSSVQKEQAMSRPKNFEAFFSDRDWSRKNGWYSLREDTLKRLDFYPNQVFQNVPEREVFIPLWLKPAPKLAASLVVPAIRYYEQRVNDGIINQAWVGFAWQDTKKYCGTTTIRELAREVRDIPPYESRQGLPDYYWFDENMRVSRSVDFASRMSANEEVL